MHFISLGSRSKSLRRKYQRAMRDCVTSLRVFAEEVPRPLTQLSTSKISSKHLQTSVLKCNLLLYFFFSEMVSNIIEGEVELETAVDYLHATSEYTMCEPCK